MGTSKKILIVDDDHETRLLLKKRLTFHGFDCTTASSVEEALQLLKTSQPQLVILDLMFRGPNGTAFLQAARQKLSVGEKLPVIVVSGCCEKDVVDLVMEMGASGFVRKPINADQLIPMINDYLV